MVRSPSYQRYKEKHKQITFQITLEEFERIKNKIGNPNAYAKTVFLNSFTDNFDGIEKAIAEKYEQKIKDLEDKIQKLRETNEALLGMS